jgi:hypothetical protein
MAVMLSLWSEIEATNPESTLVHGAGSVCSIPTFGPVVEIGQPAAAPIATGGSDIANRNHDHWR